MTRAEEGVEPLEEIESAGAWPFISYRVCRRPDGSHHVWHSRLHRKGLHASVLGGANGFGAHLRRGLWNPGQLNWWIGVVFALGSSCFLAGSLATLFPWFAQSGSLDARAINEIFFAGSIPFTTAAYLQLFQAANAGNFTPRRALAPERTAWIGWRPRDIGWLSCVLQFGGTLLFNVDTFDAMRLDLDWLQQDLEIWAPDFVGSMFFLVSGYLAYVEITHAHFAWRPDGISWWATAANLAGCVAFMISAFYAFVPRSAWNFDAGAVSVAFTAIGATGFLMGSLLMLPESAASV